MLKNRNIGWISIVLSLITGYPLFSQVIQPVLPPTSGETILLHSDRLLYGVSEKLYYTAFCQKPPQIADLEWSSVLYVELIQWNGTKLVQTKSPIEDGAAYGSIRIPESIKSGNYYLRAYTKWMRNYSPYSYTYLPVKIVNPFSISIDKGPEIDEGSAPSRVVHVAELAEAIVISDLLETYGKRQEVGLEINLLDSKLTGSYSLCVVKLESLDISNKSILFTETDQTDSLTVLEFLPELGGLSVSGKVINRRSGAPVSNMKINLSSYSDSFYFNSTNSDKEGSFDFVLPNYTGKYEFHMAIENDTSKECQILIKNEYCHKPVTLPYLAFQLGDRERVTSEEIVLNSQLAGKYMLADSSQKTKRDVHTAFYGSPGSITFEKNFIELDNLEEFLFEVVHEVTVGSSKHNPYLMVNGPSSLVSYPPLILMDNIPISDIESLLQTSCQRIDRVEVVDKGYVIDDFKYKGIISIFSKERDMAGIELTGDSHFFSYQLFADSEYASPDYSAASSSSVIADRRNLLFWEPQLQLSTRESAEISFYTSDAPGDYIVHLRSLRTDGHSTVYGTSRFTVK